MGILEKTDHGAIAALIVCRFFGALLLWLGRHRVTEIVQGSCRHTPRGLRAQSVASLFIWLALSRADLSG